LALALTISKRREEDKVLLVFLVACKRRSSANSGAWLRRFDDIIGVERSCVAKSKKGKKVKEKCCIIVT